MTADQEYASRAQNILQVFILWQPKNAVYAGSPSGFQTIMLTKAVQKPDPEDPDKNFTLLRP